MTPAEFRAARLRLDLTQAGLAQALGMSLSQVGAYERGRRGSDPIPIPRVVELAMRALATLDGGGFP